MIDYHQEAVEDFNEVIKRNPKMHMLISEEHLV